VDSWHQGPQPSFPPNHIEGRLSNAEQQDHRCGNWWGETGTPLLKQLIDAEFVDIVGLADLNAEAPGMKLVSEHSVTTTNFIELHESGNRHTIIVSELIAILLMSLSSGQLVQMKHADKEY
jgi:hypothetical protein